MTRQEILDDAYARVLAVQLALYACGDVAAVDAIEAVLRDRDRLEKKLGRAVGAARTYRRQRDYAERERADAERDLKEHETDLVAAADQIVWWRERAQLWKRGARMYRRAIVAGVASAIARDIRACLSDMAAARRA